MSKRSSFKTIISMFLALCMIVSIFSVSALSVFAAADDLAVVSGAGLDAVPNPIDPQSWVLNRDLTWDDFHPNPVIDWMTDLNPAGLARPAAVSNPANPAIDRPVIGGLIMIDYLDRKFISRQPVNSDPTGYYMYREDGPVKLSNGLVRGMEDEVTRNPVVSGAQIIADEKHDGDIGKVTDAEFGQWWADYLNKPQALNNYASIDEYYREVTFGKWAIDLTAYGPYTIPYFEFETMGYDINSSFQTYRDVPPSFRIEVTREIPRFDNVAIPFARDSGVPFANLDFFFMLHAGYDESGVWQQLGMAQFPDRQSIPYELGPGPRMLQVEEFFTADPSWLATYVTRYANYPSANFWAGELAKYEALVTAGTPELYKFKLQQSDWDWVDGYNNQTTRNTRYVAYTCWAAAVGEWSHMNTAATSLTGAGRSIRYSTQGENDGMGTFAHEFGHIGELPDQYQLAYTINNSPLTEPWDAMSRGQLGGPFGYHTRWEIPGIQGGTVPTNYMMRNKVALKVYDMKEANNSNTIAATAGATGNDILEVKISDLAAGTPLVAEVVARNIPLNNNGMYPQLNQYGLYAPNFYKGVQLEFDYSSNAAQQAALPYSDKAPKNVIGWTWTHRAGGGNINTNQPARWMGFEVVDMSGFDSFAPDHGVIISRIANQAPGTGYGFSWNAIDSHLYDIGLVDYMIPGQNGEPDDYVAHGIGQGFHLWDGAFHAGKSFVDTGYYRTEYDPADPHYDEATPRKLNTSNYDVEWKKSMIKPGSQHRWEERDGREIASGDTVNEFYDPYNNLHFYILAYNKHDGRTVPGKDKPEQFISYTIGALHSDAPGVGGELVLSDGKLTTADPGKVAVVEYKVKNTGDATDIIRITLGGDLSWNTTLLNDLYAIGAGEEITVPVYIEVPELLNKNLNESLVFTASSESNTAKKASATVANITNTAPNLALQLELDKVHLDANAYFNVDTFLTRTTESNVAVLDYTFDQSKIAYSGVSLPAGAELISWKTTDYGVQLMIMMPDYDMKGIAKAMFQAKEQLSATDDMIVAVASIVVRTGDEKAVVVLSSSLDFDPPDYPPFDLIYLSNCIDAFGATKADANWDQYKRYDFDKNGIINILDIAFAASHIGA